MIGIGTAIRHYKREDIQAEIIYSAESKEAVARFGDSFGHRPDVLKYPGEVLELAQRGATSFHASEELWSNPLRLSTMMEKAEADDLRIGWDLVLDVDCALLEYSKIAADEIVRKLDALGLESISVKFSGNKGFHIGVPFGSFPPEISGRETRLLFPDAARYAAGYIRHLIKRNVKNRLMEMEKNISQVIARTGKHLTEEFRIKHSDTEQQVQDKISGYIESFLNIDTVLISTRHLYRMPYSLHEKSGLVSLPISPKGIMGFEKPDAAPENVSVSEYRFLDREKARLNDAKELFDQAYWFYMESSAAKIRQAQEARSQRFDAPEGAVLQENWPPCIQKIMLGMEDGRKRALFILLNFLSSVGWEYKDIESLVNEWNSKNKPPLGGPYVEGQLMYHREKRKKAPPPNCSNTGYYSDMGIKCDESICSRCKNPVVFSKRRGKQG
ncbi:hypothetical protein HYY72_05250 [Candidatus Woesearchaeota archaeon]|nr:hypothetical protein [Candidatus Woesearchaeota archaeon]